MYQKLIILFSLIALFSCKSEKTSEKKHKTKVSIEKNSDENGVKISPISHATAALSFENTTIYLDPTGGSEAFKDFKAPDYILITDIHGDHMNLKTLEALDLTNTVIIAPEAVVKSIAILKAKELIVLKNGDEKILDNFKVKAIPMYNLRKEALKFHSKGRGNGYVITINDERIYFSGDTEDIPEMRNLKNIDKAFVCMNLPYTMTVESAADAVLAFKPKFVYPYHYRGTGGLSDVAKFKKIVNEGNSDIEVIQWNWYPSRK